MIVLEFRPFKRFEDDELLEKVLTGISEIKQISYDYDEYRYMLQMSTIDSMIKEIKLRRMIIDKNLIMKNIFLDLE